LTPLANLMNVEYLNYGDVLVKEGAVPDRLYIICKGSCDMVSERVSSRSK
jgi:hypothetical protein